MISSEVEPGMLLIGKGEEVWEIVQVDKDQAFCRQTKKGGNRKDLEPWWMRDRAGRDSSERNR